jgi:isopentenyl phosphate kinase
MHQSGMQGPENFALEWVHYGTHLVILCAVVVFNLNKAGNITRALSGEKIGTLIDSAGLKNQMI